MGGGVMGGGRGGGGSWRREPPRPRAKASVCHAGKLQGPGRGWTGTRGSLIPAPLCHPGGFLPTSPGALKVRGHQSAAQSATKGPSRMWAPRGTKPWPHPPPHSGRATLEGQSPLPTFRLGITGKWLPRPAPWPGPPSSPAGPARQASPPPLWPGSPEAWGWSSAIPYAPSRSSRLGTPRPPLPWQVPPRVPGGLPSPRCPVWPGSGLRAQAVPGEGNAQFGVSQSQVQVPAAWSWEGPFASPRLRSSRVEWGPCRVGMKETVPSTQ